MKAMRVEIVTPVHVELRVVDSVIVRDYRAGIVSAESDEDRLVLQRLIDDGVAKPAAGKRPPEESEA